MKQAVLTLLHRSYHTHSSASCLAASSSSAAMRWSWMISSYCTMGTQVWREILSVELSGLHHDIPTPAPWPWLPPPGSWPAHLDRGRVAPVQDRKRKKFIALCSIHIIAPSTLPDTKALSAVHYLQCIECNNEIHLDLNLPGIWPAQPGPLRLLTLRP